MMYLIFPPEYRGLADAVFTQAQHNYSYTLKVRDEELLDFVAPDTLAVVTYDIDKARREKDVAKFRWSILKAMSQGAVFISYEDVNEAHFFTPDNDLDIEECISKIITAGRYAEGRSGYFKELSSKLHYVGSTYVDPLALVVTAFDSKTENYSVDYDQRVPNVLASLPDDLWMKVGFTTARMSATLHKLLETCADSAILTLDKRISKKVEPYVHEQVTAPKGVDTEFGVEINNKVKTIDTEE